MSRSGRAALAAIVVQMGVLGVLDRGLGVPGAFLRMLASGLATFAALATFDRLTSRSEEDEAGTAAS